MDILNNKKKENALGQLIRIAILSWSAALLTASYAGLLSKMDPTFIATVFTASAATFGINTMKKGDDDDDRQHQRREQEFTLVEPTPTYTEPTVEPTVESAIEPTESSEVSDSGDSPDYTRASTNI